jgi:hypothetical protein
LVALITGLILGAAVVAAVAGDTRLRSAMRIKVIEHATSDTVIDTGGAGDTAGDLLTFHNKVYNAANTAVVGNDRGDCVRINPAAGSWECRWVTNLAGGSLTVEGTFWDTRGSVLAITGGTGRFRNARGSMELRSRAGGTEFAFVFNVIP